MLIRELLDHERDAYDTLVDHPLQTWAWGEARQATGVRVIRLGVFDNKKLIKAWMMTGHEIPKLNKFILYCPRGPMPDEQFTEAIDSEARKLGAVFVKLEPNEYTKLDERFDPDENQDPAIYTLQQELTRQGYRAGRPLFTPYNFIIDLTKPEDELMANMKPKTRYNVRLAEKKGVKVIEDNSDQAFDTYLELMAETTSRQKFYAHDVDYHRQIWQHMRAGEIAHLLTAIYEKQILAAWVLFKWKDKLYYPYGASSRQFKEVMANNLMMWEAIKFGKQQGCKIFDLWGTAGLNPKPSDHWYGFHRFKEGYGPQVVQYIGAYDWVIDPTLYPIVTTLDKFRRAWLRVRSSFSSVSF